MTVTPAPAEIEPGSLERWFKANVPGAVAPFRYERVAGGHSCLTYVVSDADGTRFVLRRPPLGQALATAHDVAREHRIMAALAQTDVPVPDMVGVSSGTAVNGAPFFVMRYVPGVVLHSAEDAEHLLPDDAARRRAGESLVDALVALHHVEPDDVGLGDLSQRAGYLDRQLKRWSRQWDASKTRDRPEMEDLHRWLEQHRPDEGPARIVHGDFRLGNALHADDGSVVAILDWELCTLGDPLADVSYLLRSWWSPNEPPRSGAGLEQHPSSAAGFPHRDELLVRYTAASGRSLADLDYWTAFHGWRSAAITEGVYRRYLDGKMGARPDDIERYPAIRNDLIQSALRAAKLA